jgi:magnesium-transporting ATPase (P-type)
VGRPLAPPSPTPKERRSAAKTNHQNIRVSPAVLDAARKDGEALFQDLGTSPAGLSQVEAEERARAKGPNEIAQERKQGWPIRIPKIIRNPLIVLLTLLSSVSFLTGDARAGCRMENFGTEQDSQAAKSRCAAPEDGSVRCRTWDNCAQREEPSI